MRHLFFLTLAACLLVLSACGSSDDSPAQVIVDKAIEAHGGKQFENFRLAFDFRDKHYTMERNGGLFSYTREFADSTGQVKDVLTNTGFSRQINGNTVDLPEERKEAYSNSVNSVHYFALLPFGLNDPAVNKSYIGETEIKDTPYHLIKVTFGEYGGGEDFEDQFLYWINANTYTMDYLAYSYFEKDEKHYRFREAKNPREVGGIRFQDYINYKPTSREATLESLEDLYEQGKLEELSRINLMNIQMKGK